MTEATVVLILAPTYDLGCQYREELRRRDPERRPWADRKLIVLRDSFLRDVGEIVRRKDWIDEVHQLNGFQRRPDAQDVTNVLRKMGVGGPWLNIDWPEAVPDLSDREAVERWLDV